MVVLKSADDQEFRAEKDVVLRMRSNFVADMLENAGEHDDTLIPLPNVPAAVLQKVLDYCDHHRNDPLPDPIKYEDVADGARRRTSEDISEWDMKFIGDVRDQNMLFDMILAAENLDIGDLLGLGCITVTNMIKGKTPEQIRQMFNIVNDFTPEEEEQIRRENAWADDR